MSGSDEAYKGLKVLVVEDNHVNQKVVTAMLDHYGVNVEIAGNGAIALDKVKNTKYDLVIMDCQMPEVNGFEATRKIRQLKKGESETDPDVTIVAMTANTSKSDSRECFDAGMNDFIAKPVDLNLIDNMLRKWYGSDR